MPSTFAALFPARKNSSASSAVWSELVCGCPPAHLYWRLTVVDIQHDVVDRAINNAAAHEVGRVVNHAVRCVEDDLARQTQKCVRDAVRESYGKLSKSVSDAIAREAAKVDGNRIMEDATEKAKEMLLERFDGKLDGLMSDYQRNLDNVGKIYQSIASSMADKAGKNVTMTLG